jgi:hypothetical protein
VLFRSLDYNVDQNGLVTINHFFDNDTFFQQLPNFDSQNFTADLKTINNNIYLEFFYLYIVVNGRIDDSSQTILRELTVSEINIIESITLLFNQLFDLEDFVQKLDDYDFYILFEKYFEIFQAPIGPFNTHISSAEYYKTFNSQYFAFLYLRLLEFYQRAKSFQKLFFDESTLLAYIVGLIGHHGLKNLSYVRKKDFLSDVLTDNRYITGRWNPLLSKNKLTIE